MKRSQSCFARNARLAAALHALALPAVADVLMVPQEYPTVQDAVDAAQDGDEIAVDPGTYVERIVVSGKDVVLRSTGGAADTLLVGFGYGSVVTFVNDADCTLQGFGVVSGAYDDGGGVLCDGGSDVRILDNEFRGNYADQTGGAITAWSSAVEVRGNLFEDNTAGYDGGAVSVSGLVCTVFENNTFRRNLCTYIDGRGGALVATGAATHVEGNVFEENDGWEGGALATTGDGSVILANEFRDNHTDYHGAAIWTSGHDVEIRRNVIRENDAFAAYGGGIYSTGDRLIVADNEIEDNFTEWFGVYSLGQESLIERNTISGHNGGGLRCHGSSVVRDCLIQGNSSSYWEPGLDMSGGTGGLVERCSILDNSVEYAMGGVRILNAEVELRDCLIARNSHARGSIDGDGAGVYVENASVTILRCTLTENVAGTSKPTGGGAGLHFDATAYGCRVESCVVWGNQAPLGGPDEIFDGSGTLVVEHSDVAGGWPGVGNLDVEPLFADPSLDDWTLQTGSPCVDAGSPADLPLGADLLGKPRLLDGDLDGVLVVDMGAHESTLLDFQVVGTLEPGSTATLDFQGPGSWLATLFFSAHPGSVLLAPFGALAFDPTKPFGCPFGVFALPASFSVAIPTDPTVFGLYVLQGVAADPTSFVGQVSQAHALEIGGS